MQFKLSIFFPSMITDQHIKSNHVWKQIKHSFDTSMVLLCYCHKCARLYFLYNDFVQISRFNHNFITKISKHIKNEKMRQELLGYYSIISTKEGLIKDMIAHNGFLNQTCHECLRSFFTDIIETMRETKKEVIIVSDREELYVTKELIDKMLPLIDEMYFPMHRGYTTLDNIQKDFNWKEDNKNGNNPANTTEKH